MGVDPSFLQQPHIARLLPPEKPDNRAEKAVAAFKSFDRYERERDLQDAALAWLRANDWFILSHQRMDVKSSSTIAGQSDIIAVKKGNVICAEAKVGAAKPRLDQVAYIEAAALHGACAFVFRSLAELIAAIALA